MADPLSRLADIDLASPDPTTLWLYLGAALAVLALGCAWALRRWWLSSRGNQHNKATRAERALIRLESLRERWTRGGCDDRQTAYLLATVLRLGLGLNQLHRDVPAPDGIDHRQWHSTLALLEHLRYSACSEARLEPAVFNQLRDWLRVRHSQSMNTAPC